MFIMPRNTREWAQRKLTMAGEGLDWPLTHLEEVREVYQEQHPEIGNSINLAQGAIIEVKKLIASIKTSF